MRDSRTSKNSKGKEKKNKLTENRNKQRGEKNDKHIYMVMLDLLVVSFFLFGHFGSIDFTPKYMDKTEK